MSVYVLCGLCVAGSLLVVVYVTREHISEYAYAHLYSVCAKKYCSVVLCKLFGVFAWVFFDLTAPNNTRLQSHERKSN